MTKLTAVHHSVSKLWDLIYRRNWKLAYQAADELDTVIHAEENDSEICLIHTACTITDIAEAHFKRVAYGN